jgi:hypothetical protein
LSARSQNYHGSQRRSRLAQFISTLRPSADIAASTDIYVGCGAFNPVHRNSVRSPICTIKEYTWLADTDLAHEVLEWVWKYMDEKHERNRDWQVVAHEMRMSF